MTSSCREESPRTQHERKKTVKYVWQYKKSTFWQDCFRGIQPSITSDSLSGTTYRRRCHFPGSRYVKKQCWHVWPMLSKWILQYLIKQHPNIREVNVTMYWCCGPHTFGVLTCEVFPPLSTSQVSTSLNPKTCVPIYVHNFSIMHMHVFHLRYDRRKVGKPTPLLSFLV